MPKDPVTLDLPAGDDGSLVTQTAQTDRPMTDAEAAEFKAWQQAKLSAEDKAAADAAAEAKADEDAGYELLPLLGGLHRKLKAQGHTLHEVIAKAAKNAFGVDL